MARILVAFSTVDGHTRKICARIGRLLEERGHAVTLAEVTQASAMDCTAFDKIVVGASIRYGKYRPALFDFIGRHADRLRQVPSAFFSVNVVARKPGKDTPEGNPYIRVFRRQSPWQPAEVAVFAGKIEYARYTWADRLMIRFIMWITAGPTDPATNVEFTDWAAVDAFAERIARA